MWNVGWFKNDSRNSVRLATDKNCLRILRLRFFIDSSHALYLRDARSLDQNIVLEWERSQLRTAGERQHHVGASLTFLKELISPDTAWSSSYLEREGTRVVNLVLSKIVAVPWLRLKSTNTSHESIVSGNLKLMICWRDVSMPLSSDRAFRSARCLGNSPLRMLARLFGL